MLMQKSLQFHLFFTLFLACFAVPVYAQSLYGEYQTQDGQQLILPEAAQVSCGEINRVLSAIDNTGYREGPTLRHSADEPLLQYEESLSARRFSECIPVN